MRLTLPLSAARPLAGAALCARLILGVFIDTPQLYNAGWIPVLLSVLLCAPLMLLADSFTRASGAIPTASALESHAGKGLTRTVCGLYALVFLYETAVAASALADTARYVSFADTPIPLLLLPLLAVAVLSALLNGLAVGGIARLWLKVAPPLLVLILLCQVRHFCPQWLTPLLGPGPRALAAGTVDTAGWLAPLAALWLCAEPDARDVKRRAPLLTTLLTVGIVCAALVALLAMMAPASLHVELTRSLQLDKLLSNGRMSLSLQFPLVLLWYNTLIFAVVGGIFAGAKLLQLAIPALDGRLCIPLMGVAAAALSLLGLAGHEGTTRVARWLFPGVAVPFFALMLPPIIRKGEKNHAHR